MFYICLSRIEQTLVQIKKKVEPESHEIENSLQQHFFTFVHLSVEIFEIKKFIKNYCFTLFRSTVLLQYDKMWLLGMVLT